MMATIATRELRELLQQSRYSPLKHRLLQLDGCETLLRLIHPGGEYPFDFVRFHLTGLRGVWHFEAGGMGDDSEPSGFHGHAVAGSLAGAPTGDRDAGGLQGGGGDWEPATASVDRVIGYDVLVGDLASYSLSLSKDMKIPVAAMSRRFLTLDELGQRLGVCGKTLKRWSRRGLIGRYLLYADGQRRLAYSEEAVKLFQQRNRSNVLRGRGFSRMSADERHRIQRRLIRFAGRCPDARQESIERIAGRFGRSVESVRRLLVGLEGRGTKPLFARRAERVEAADQCRLYQRYQEGVAVKQLMKEAGLSRSTVYTAIQRERVRLAMGQVVEYVGEPCYYKDANRSEWLVPRRELFAEPIVVGVDESAGGDGAGRVAAVSQTGGRVAGGSRSPGSVAVYAAQVGRFGVLTAEQEQFLFRRYNYLKYLAFCDREELSEDRPRSRSLRRFRYHLAMARRVKEMLVHCNLRLVLSTARKHTRDETVMMELIGEGNVILMRAVELFDFRRGTRFSTYATWALVKRFATLRSTWSRERAVLAVDSGVIEAIGGEQSGRESLLEAAAMSLGKAMRECLEHRERVIVEQRYGLRRGAFSSGRGKLISFRQIGDALGLSKERVRQLEQAALTKLRRVLTMDQFEALLEP